MAICVYGMRLGDAAKHLQMTPQVLSAKLYRAKSISAINIRENIIKTDTSYLIL